MQNFASKLDTDSTPTFANILLTGLTASRLTASSSTKELESVANLANWIAGTTNQVTVTDDSDGTITLSLPQDIHTSATPTFARQTLTDTCLIAGGANILRVTGLQTDGTAMTGTLRGAYIDVSNGNTAATGTIRGMELKARTEAPGDVGNNVNVLEGLSISADSKDHSVTTMRAAEFILDGSTGGTITEAVGLRIANNLQANKATASYGLQIYRDSFNYTYDISLSLGGHITGDSYINQDVRTTASPTFADVILTDWQYSTPTYNSVHDWMNTTQSAGLVSGGVISDATGGNINVTAGTGFAKSADTEIATTLFVDWAARNGIAIASGSKYTVYVDYDADPQVKVTTDPGSDIDYTTAFSIGSVFYDGTTMHVLNEAGTRAYNLARRTHQRARKLRGFERATGLVTGDEGTRYFSVTSGTIYAGLNQISISGCDSSDPDADTFTTWYYDGDLGGGTWVKTTGVRQLDNVQYNAIATGLANLTSNRYGIHWIYMDVDNHCNVLYGQGNYTLALAQGAVIPLSLPSLLSDFAILVAKVIVREGNAEIIEIATAFETTFGVSVANNHNELANLQGGTTNEYYHLTSAEHTAVGALGATYQPLDDVLTDISALNVVADNEFIVGTGAGVYAHESGATARTSIGLGTGDSPTFTGLTLSGNLTMPDGGTIGQAAGPLLTFDDTNNFLEISGCKVGVGTAAPSWIGHFYFDASGDDGVLIEQAYSTGSARALCRLKNDTGETAQLAIGSSNYSTPNLTMFAATKAFKIGTDAGVETGGSNTFYVYVGGWGAANKRFEIASATTYVYNDLTLSGDLTIADGKAIGQAAGPLLTFDDTNNYLEITGCKVGIGNSTPAKILDLVSSVAGDDGLYLLNSSANVNARAIFRLTNDDGKVAQFAIRSSTHGTYPNATFFASSRDFRVVTDSGDASGGSSVFTVKTGGYGTSYDTTIDSTGNLKLTGTILMKEGSAAIADVAAYGQIWVKDDAPNILMFTNDAGSDFTVDVTPV